MQNKSLTKTKLQLSSERQAKITAIFITHCGNFAVVGYSDGQIIKFNMQSGLQRSKMSLKKTKGISFLYVDSYNKFLFAMTETSYLLLCDFYKGKLIKYYQLKGQVVCTRPSQN